MALLYALAFWLAVFFSGWAAVLLFLFRSLAVSGPRFLGVVDERFDATWPPVEQGL